MKKTILAVNPWIYDFAAYNLWVKPLGFLHILSVLKEAGLDIKYIDCLHEKGGAPLKKTSFGTYKFASEIVDKPEKLAWVPRHYKRYGISKDKFIELIKPLDPDLILLTSSMTYWYPGIFEVINILKQHKPGIPVMLGGIYPTLCYEHAESSSNADYLIKNDQLGAASSIIKKHTRVKPDLSIKNIAGAEPAYSFYDKTESAAIRTSWGCPFRCAYCANELLNSGYMEIDADKVLGVVSGLYEKGVRNFAFYDDALLYNQDRIKYILNRIIEKGLDINIHTPNGLHVRFITEEIARLMKKSNFVDPHLGFEFDDKERKWHDKVTLEEMEEKIGLLSGAGYEKGGLTVYLMIGMPGQDFDEQVSLIRHLHRFGARISLSEFSPIPKTRIWDECGIRDPDPLFHNNSIFPLYKPRDWQRINRLKLLAKNLNTIFS